MAKTHDPREAGPKPPFPQQPQTHPGSVHQMDPPADHGEDSYEGTGKLKGRVAIITGGRLRNRSCRSNRFWEGGRGYRSFFPARGAI